MYRSHTVGVVLPAYNEADHIGDVLADLPAFVDRIYAVDDASTDDTWAVLAAHARADDGDAADEDARTVGPSAPVGMADGGQVAPRLVPIRHEENRGAGGALVSGYRRAREDGVDLVVAMDADGQMDPRQMPRLLDPLVEGDADYAKGDRLGADGGRMPPFRLVGNWLLTGLTRVASGYWRLNDPQNGYTAITHEALAAVDLDAVPDGHEYANDLLVRLNVAGMRVADVPMSAVYGDEESTISYSRFVPVTAATLLGAFLWRLWAVHLGGLHTDGGQSAGPDDDT